MLRTVSHEVFRVSFYSDPLRNIVLYFFILVSSVVWVFFFSKKGVIFGFQIKSLASWLYNTGSRSLGRA